MPYQLLSILKGGLRIDKLIQIKLKIGACFRWEECNHCLVILMAVNFSCFVMPTGESSLFFLISFIYTEIRLALG